MTTKSTLLERATAPEVQRASTLADTIGRLDPSRLVDEYKALQEAAPRRGQDGYVYFVDRTGKPSSGAETNRGEELLAMALVNDGMVVTVDDEAIEMLMYAFPLYTTGGPQGIRGVDLVGHAAQPGRFWVVELKVAAGTGYGETPLRALYETLIYGAVVEANFDHIAAELEARGLDTVHWKPGLLIAAPEDYWRRWTPNHRIGDWWAPFRSLTEELAAMLGCPIATTSLGPVSYRFDENKNPRTIGRITSHPVNYTQ